MRSHHSSGTSQSLLSIFKKLSSQLSQPLELMITHHNIPVTAVTTITKRNCLSTKIRSQPSQSFQSRQNMIAHFKHTTTTITTVTKFNCSSTKIPSQSSQPFQSLQNTIVHLKHAITTVTIVAIAPITFLKRGISYHKPLRTSLFHPIRDKNSVTSVTNSNSATVLRKIYKRLYFQTSLWYTFFADTIVNNFVYKKRLSAAGEDIT